jgi:putative endonuclease
MAQVPTGANRRSQLSKQTGDARGSRARRWLERHGLRFIAANARERGGEIDLIMRDGAVIVFVEVRYRRSASYGDAAASVTPQKQQRLLKAARLWLSRQNGSFDTVDCRFDVVAFTGNDIQWLKNAFGE